MKKKIVIVTSEFGKQGGGLSNSATKLFQLLIEIGFQVEIIISSQSSDKEKIQSDNNLIHNTVVVSSGGYNTNLQIDLFFRGHLNNLLNLLRTNLPDLIIAFGSGLNGVFASEISKKLKIKMVLMPRGSELNLAISNAELFHFNRECLSQASAIVSVSNELLERAQQIHYNPNCKYRVIPNTISFNNTTNSKLQARNDSPIILGTGAKYLNEKKGVLNLIYALEFLNRNSKKKFSLHLCGFIDEDLKTKYQEHISSLHLEQSVKFLGALSRNEFLNEMQGWDIALQCSFCEGFSNSIGDAISISKPFMISNTGFIAEQIATKFPDLIFSELSPNSIAEKISETYFNKNISKLCEEASNQIKNSVSEDSVLSEWKAFINEVFSVTQKEVVKASSEHVLTLMLHELSDSDFSSVDLPKEKFAILCQLVNDAGFKFCSAEEYFKASDKTNLIVCTFDDGYNSVLKFGLPILKKFSFTATVFVCTDHIGKLNDWNPKDKAKRIHMKVEELKTLKDEGWEIGSHGTTHISFNRLDEIEIRKSMLNSKNILTEYFGSVVSFAYPYGDTSPFIQKIATEYFQNVFRTEIGGTNILLDRYRIKRYLFNEIETLFVR